MTAAPSAPTTVPTAPTRYHRLDGLRAVWVVGVMAHHLEFTFIGFSNGVFTGFGRGVLPGGWLPVDGFFVLSGFLLGGALVGEWERHGRIRYGHFLLRRLGRLYPALVVLLAAMTATSMLLDHVAWADLWPSVVGPATYTYNLFYSTDLPQLFEAGHLWSLSVEFQFYLLLPLLVAGLSRLRAPRGAWFALIAAVAVASALARRRLGFAHFPETYLDLPFRLDSLLWGVLAALAVRWGWIGERHRLVLRVLGPLAGAVLVWQYLTQGGFDPEIYTWGIACSSVASTVVVLWIFVDGRGLPARILGSAPMAAAGARSYSAYLWHFPIFFALARHQAELDAWTRSALGLAATALVSDLSYRFVELPFIRASARWRSSAPRFAEAPDGDRSGSVAAGDQP